MFFSGDIKNYNFFPRIPLIWLAILRGVFLAFAQLCFFISLLFLNFATATTLQQTTPFVVALLSIPILGTKVGFWKVLALMIGFSGVLLIIKPGNDFLSYYAFLPLGASFGYGINLVLVKLYPKNVPTILIQYYTQLSATLITLAILFVSSKFVIISPLTLDLITKLLFSAIEILSQPSVQQTTKSSKKDRKKIGMIYLFY